MHIRHVGFSAAAWAVLAGAAWGGDARGKDRPITIIASPATLKVGARCRVELNPPANGRTKVVTTNEGVISRANDQGVGLKVDRVEQSLAGKNTHAPVISRLFRNVGIVPPNKPEKAVWMPSDTIHSVELLGKDAAGG